MVSTTINRGVDEITLIDDARGLLRFEMHAGRIWLDDERSILVRRREMRALRRELIESLGVERAKGVITRMGYIAGYRDADRARELLPDVSHVEAFIGGAKTHMVTGQIKAIPIELDIDDETGDFKSVFEGENSFEADVFLAEFGTAVSPVCWAQAGYASGYASRLVGREIYFIEEACSACGAERCRLVGKPLEDWENAAEIKRYYDKDKIADQIHDLQSQIVSLRDSSEALPGFDRIVGNSVPFLHARDLVAKAASSNVAVLLLGETGVGKDMFAKALHQSSTRSDKPFLAVNCAAIPADLIEAELFGVERGAYTGAESAREGRFERADGGTLFLDEVGELSLSAQASLLRVLQNQELERVGGVKTRKVDVRLITATNEDLQEAIADGRFRADLFYRLSVYPVTVPPLRERIEDVPALVDHFIMNYTNRHGVQVAGISDDAMSLLQSYRWPGNIRELANVIERGVIVAPPGGMIESSHVFPHVAIDAESGQVIDDNSLTGLADSLLKNGSGIDEFEKVLLDRAMDQAGGTVSKAARYVGISRATMDYRLKKAGLR